MNEIKRIIRRMSPVELAAWMAMGSWQRGLEFPIAPFELLLSARNLLFEGRN